LLCTISDNASMMAAGAVLCAELPVGVAFWQNRAI